MALFSLDQFKTQYFLVFSALNILRYFGLFDRVVTMVGSSIVMTTAAWNATKYVRTFMNRELITSFKRAVVVTGSDKGLGHEIAMKMNEHGFKVYATVLNTDSENAEKLMTGCRFDYLMNIRKMNVAIEEDVNKVAEEIKTELEANGEELWAVINAAEVREFGHFDWAQFEMYEKIFNVNTFGTVRTVRAFLPLLRKSRGRIVNIESIAGRLTVPKLTAFCMSKHANLAFADALRREMVEWGITVSTIELAFDRKPSSAAYQKFPGSIRTQYANSSADVKLTYSTDYLEQIKLENLAQLFQNDLDAAMEDIIDAVRGQDPLIRYTPYTSKKAKLFSNIAQMVPIEWLDKYFYSMEKDAPKPSRC